MAGKVSDAKRLATDALAGGGGKLDGSGAGKMSSASTTPTDTTAAGFSGGVSGNRGIGDTDAGEVEEAGEAGLP